MPNYSYKATDQSGKIFKGFLEAADDQEALSQLDELGYIPIRIESSAKKQEKKEWKPGSFSMPKLFHRVSGRATMAFTQDLAALLDAGLPLDRALEILIEASGNETFGEIIGDILLSVQKGHYLSDAMAQHPKVFTLFYTNMVKAGEAGGVLDDVLERLGIFLASSQELKDYIKSAMLYPVFLLGVGSLSILVLLTFVIPKFSLIFEDTGRSMPLATQLLLSFSEILQNWWWLIAALFALFAFAFRHYTKTGSGRYRLDTWKLRLPILGDLIRKIEIARFSRTLGTLVHSGVPILQALELVRDIISNRVIAASLDKVHSRVKEGEKLAGPLSASGVFPPMAIQMLMVGEETGRLNVMLLRVADNYEKIVRSMIKKGITMIEPVMILTMGIVIGFIVITMLMAIFSMNELPF